MASSEQIKYSDLINPDVKVGLDDLEKTLADLSKEMIGMKKRLQENQFDQGGKSVKNFNKALEDTVSVTQDLESLQKQEIRLRTKLVTLTKEEEGQRDILKEQISQNTRYRKAEVKEMLAQEGSMTQLSLELAKNKKAYRELTEAQRNNTKVGGTLLKSIQKQDAQIKKLDATIGNHQRNVGNYGSALNGLSGQFGVLGGKMGQIPSIVAGVRVAFGTLKTALISTGIGAIVVAIGSLIAFFTDAASGANRFARAMAPLTAAMKTAWNVAKAFGESLTLLFDGKFEEAFNLQRDAVRGLGDEYRRVLDLQEQMVENHILLHEATRDSILPLQQLRTELKRLEAVAKDGNLPIQQRIEAQEKALELARQISKTEQEISQLRVAALVLESQQSEDTEEAEIKLQQARAAHSAILEKQFNTEGRLITYLSGLQRKAGRESEEMIKIERLGIDQVVADIETKLIPARMKLRDEYTKDTQALKGTADFTYQQLGQMGNTWGQYASSVTGNLSIAAQYMGATAEEMKALNIAQATINAFMGASMALASAPPPVGPILAVIALAAGLATVGQIASTPIPKPQTSGAQEYAEGTDYVEQGGNKRGIDTVPAMLTVGERVVPESLNRQLMGVTNDALPGLVKMGLSSAQVSDDISRIAESQLNEQKNTNRLLGRMKFYDPTTKTIITLDGNKQHSV